MLTTRYPWGVTTVLLCTLLLQNCQSNSLRATEEEGLASGSSSASGMRHLASIVPQATLYLPLSPPSSAPAVHVPPSRSPIAPAHKKALTTTPSSRSLGPPVPPILATVGTPSKVPSTLQPAAIPRFSHAVQLRNTPSHFPSPVLTTSSGERVKFSQVGGQWCAAIQAGSSVSTFQRTMPVVGSGDIKAQLASLQRQDVWASRSRIHIMATSYPPYAPCVYLGKSGLLGGMPTQKTPLAAAVVRANAERDAAVAWANEAVSRANAERDETVSRANEAVVRANAEKDAAVVWANEAVVRANAEKDAAVAWANEAVSRANTERDAAVAWANKAGEALAARDQEIAQTSNAIAAALRPFGEAEWKQYFGDVGSAPDLPSDMAAILNSSCPFWLGKQVKDTHLLVLVPATVDGRPFTLDLLRELIKSPKGGGSKTEYCVYGNHVLRELGAQSPRSSYWVLMTRDVLPDSRNKTYDAQKALVAAHASRLGLPYEMPHVLAAATAILLHHVRTGERLYTDAPWTITRCQEKVDNNRYPVLIGGFSSGGLRVNDDCVYDYRSLGVSCLRKF
jgi:hypothetical protein